MKTIPRPVVALLALFLLVPSSGAAAAPEGPGPGWLGVFVGDPDTSSRGADATETSPEVEGALVLGIIEGSPAEKARLRGKDSIVAVDGAVVSGASELIARLRELEPGSFVTLSVKRRGHDLEMSTVVGTRPTETNRWKMVRGWLGVEGIELPASLREHFGAPEGAGILVSKVFEASPAADSGIRVGDVMYEADGEPVTSLRALSRIVSEAGVENAIDVVLARDGARIVVEPRIARATDIPPR